VEAQRFKLKQSYKNSRQEMLSRMLLHVVIASRPIDLAGHNIQINRSIRNMRNELALVDYVNDRLPAQDPEIVRLTTRARIKGRSIEINAPSILGPVEYPRLEPRQIIALSGWLRVVPTWHPEGARAAIPLVGVPESGQSPREGSQGILHAFYLDR
jgi:hypothetical protein